MNILYILFLSQNYTSTRVYFNEWEYLLHLYTRNIVNVCVCVCVCRMTSTCVYYTILDVVNRKFNYFVVFETIFYNTYFYYASQVNMCDTSSRVESIYLALRSTAITCIISVMMNHNTQYRPITSDTRRV